MVPFRRCGGFGFPSGDEPVLGFAHSGVGSTFSCGGVRADG